MGLKLAWPAAIALSTVLLAAPAVPLAEMVATLDGRYNSMSTWTADFTQLYTGPGATRQESGRLYLSKPGKMRWDYQQPVMKTFLVAGHDVWQYTAGDPTASRNRIKATDDLRTPLRFLLGHTDLDKELNDLAYSNLPPLRPGDAVLQGKALPQETDTWREVWIEVTPAYEIDRLVIAGADGSRNDIRLSHIQPNAKLPASLFRFTPPPGVTVVPGS